MIRKTLPEDIASVLQAELKDYDHVIVCNGNIMVVISTEDFIHRLGMFYKHTVKIIDRHFPERDEDLRLLFRDPHGRHENVFKIWPPWQCN